MIKKIPTIKFTRVVGYVRPIILWNKGKQSEWSKRKIIASSSALGMNAR